MSGINFLGSYSGIDRNTIDQLIKAESMPLVRLKGQKDNIIKEQGVWKDVNTRLNNLFDKIKVLQDPKFFNARKGTSTSDEHVMISTNEKAIAGDYKVSIERLATSTSIIGKKIDGIEDASKELGKTGKFIIKSAAKKDDGSTFSGVEGLEIDIKEEDSLKDIVNKINDVSKDFKDADGKTVKGTGVKASIIDNHIVLTDTKTGNREIELEDVEGNLTSELGLKGDGVELTEGTTAKFSVNGISVERNTNDVSDVIEGVTIKLRKTHDEGKSDTIKVDLDYEKAEKTIQEFVDQFNSTMSFIEENIKAGDPEVSGSGGALSGDSGLKRLHDELRKMATEIVSRDSGSIKDISEIGITTTDKSGTLSLNSAELQKALKEDSQKVMDFFFKKGEDGKVSGFADKMNGKIDQFISKKNGIIKGKNESYDKVLKDINTRMESFTERIARKEAYYIKKFSELDNVMMKAEGQMSWLQSQVSGMNQK